MYNDEDLAAAVRDGVLSQEAVDAFQAYMVQGRPLPVVDEEHFRLVSGFNDIFVVISCLLLLAALGLTREEMRRPLIGIANSANEIIPGHIHLDKIVQAVKDGDIPASRHRSYLRLYDELKDLRAWQKK